MQQPNTPALPIEIWHRIATVNLGQQRTWRAGCNHTEYGPHLDPGAYWVLVRVAKFLAISNAVTLFIRRDSDGNTVTPRGHNHSVNDQPSKIVKYLHGDPARYWYRFGLAHRELGPAIINSTGQRWCWGGRLHRDGGPAVIGINGDLEWYQRNKRHRDNDLPAVIEADGTQVWYQHDKRHRDHGPAVIYPSGGSKWYRHDELHRTGGPADIDLGGSQKWYIDGRAARGFLPTAIHHCGRQEWGANNTAGLIVYYMSNPY